MEALTTGRGHRYCLTQAGEEFRAVIHALATWGQRWTTRIDRKNFDPSLLIWNMRRRVALDRLPPHRVVLRLRFRGVAPSYRGPRTFWLVLERPEVDLCVVDPGFEVDLYVDADASTLASVWLGDLPFASALRSNKVELLGTRERSRAPSPPGGCSVRSPESRARRPTAAQSVNRPGFRAFRSEPAARESRRRERVPPIAASTLESPPAP